MKDGVIADFEITEAMLRYFIHSVHERAQGLREAARRDRDPVRHHAGREARRDQLGRARGRAARVYLIEEPMAAAIGVGLPVDGADRRR